MTLYYTHDEKGNKFVSVCKPPCIIFDDRFSVGDGGGGGGGGLGTGDGR